MPTSLKIGGTVAAITFAGIVLYAGQPQAINSVADLKTVEDAYVAANGKPLQILENGTLPSYETGIVSDKLGKSVPAGYQVDIYQTPKGEWGYQITDSDGSITATGPEAASRAKLAPAKSATSTP